MLRVTRRLFSSLRPRKALFYVPASEPRKLASSLKLKDLCDCFCYDLEDGVEFSKKQLARINILDALDNFSVGRSEKCVRINAIGYVNPPSFISGLENDDLNVVLKSRNLDSILIPKVQSPNDIFHVVRAIESSAANKDIKLIASIESAIGLMNIKEIASCHPSIVALLFAAEDYCADLSLTRTPTRLELLYARQLLVATAVAHNLQSIDMVCIDYKSPTTLTTECNEGREFGFTGKQAIHPTQVGVIQELFLPQLEQVEFAKRVMRGFEGARREGKGAFEVDGKVVDMPVIKWAERILARANIVVD
ncbi:hypothetical protein HK098_002812 [Nowakowskiella sp. JEL0407]|nr:hypothetical protein HK098_002812 [Nowakowskiella sp. JEL0407]